MMNARQNRIPIAVFEEDLACFERHPRRTGWSAALLVALTSAGAIGVARAAPTTFTERPPPSTTAQNAASVVAADIDRDGDADIDILCEANPVWKIQLFENQANFTEADGDGVRDDLDWAPSNAGGDAGSGVRDARCRDGLLLPRARDLPLRHRYLRLRVLRRGTSFRGLPLTRSVSE